MHATDEYCIICGEGSLRHELQVREFEVRGETLRIQVPVSGDEGASAGNPPSTSGL